MLIVAALATWYFATVANSTRFGDALLRRLGLFGTFVPIWNFFAPNPGTHDFHFLTRARLGTGEVTHWKQHMLFEPPRGTFAWLWNPEKIERKTLYDLAVTLAGEIAAVGDDTPMIKLSMPYLMLASYTEGLPKPAGTEAVQFMLMRSSAIEPDADTVFVSEFHPLE